MSKKGNLDSIFNPKSVAIAGVSTGNYGQMFLDNVLGYGFRGKVYPLNPKGEEISGLKVYANIRDIPESVDYVISCIPAVLVSQLIKDCITKGVKVVSLIATGRGKIEDIDLLIELAEDVKEGSLCGLGETAPNPVLTTLRYFRSEYEAHIIEHRCPALVCKELIAYYILPDRCEKGCEHCVLTCPTEAISGEKGKIKVIDQTKCVKCGTCREVCPPEYNAVAKLSPPSLLPG